MWEPQRQLRVVKIFSLQKSAIQPLAQSLIACLIAYEFLRLVYIADVGGAVNAEAVEDRAARIR
jgi:hypothetical protein